MTNPFTFGEWLRHWRLGRGLSQTDFGELLDPKVRHSTVCCWENDLRRPSFGFIRQIIDITGIPVDLALRAVDARQKPEAAPEKSAYGL
jgi:transcriptional regulator with XRE-family HTH domain